MGAIEKREVLIKLIKKLIKSIKPFQVILHKDQKPVVTYLYSIDVAGLKTESSDIKQMLKAALKYLKDSNNKSNLTVRLLIGKTKYGIDDQIDFLDNKYTNLTIAY